MKKIKSLSLSLILMTVLIFAGCSDTKEDLTQKNNNKKEESSDLKNKPKTTNEGIKKEISAAESNVEWVGKKVTGEHYGTVDISNGEIFVDENLVTGGSFEIDFTTIKVIDIKDAESNAKLTNHLKSGDFFATDNHPKGKFEIISVNKVSGDKYNVTGDLSIKGISKEISFPAEIKISDNKVTATADFEIDRTLWDIQYRSGKFFENLGDKLISDNFQIKFNINTL